MDFQIQFLSFYVIQVEGKGENADKRYKHFQTLNEAEYEESQLKEFLDGEFTKIVKRKAERHPNSEEVPTKIGFFIVEEGHELTSNPNYNQFSRVRFAESKSEFQNETEKFAVSYVDTSAVRGGVFLVARAKLRKYFDEPFVFIMKCDFEPKVASISDESTLIRHVEMAITTKNMKSIQYPYMPEEGMVEERELKINQSSHARYFEDFLKFVEYGESMQEIVKSQVLNIVQDHIEESFSAESGERQAMEQAMELWAGSEKRELQEKFSTDQIVEAAAQIVEHTPDIPLKMKLDHISVQGLLSDFGENLHVTKINNKYVLMIEADAVVFEKGFSPVELVKPEDIHSVLSKIRNKS